MRSRLLEGSGENLGGMAGFFFKDSDVYKFQLYSSLAYATNFIPLRMHFLVRIFPQFSIPIKPKL